MEDIAIQKSNDRNKEQLPTNLDKYVVEGDKRIIR